MSKRILMPLLAGIIVLTGLLLPAPAHAATIIIGADCTLVDAIIAANTDAPSGGCPAGDPGLDIIELTGDIVLTTPFTTDDGGVAFPPISSPIIIRGNGFTISRADGSPRFRFFYVLPAFLGGANADLTLENMTLTNGSPTNWVTGDPIGSLLGRGGAIAAGNTLRVDNVTFIDNFTNRTGGAISVFFGTNDLVVVDSTFINNEAGNADGATGATGGAIERFGNIGVIRVSNSTFTGNSASFRGGAIASQGLAVIEDSTFSGNTVTLSSTDGGGGAIMSNDFTSELQIRGSTFSGNSACYGGAVRTRNGSDLLASGSTFSGNNAPGFACRGGAIYASGGGNSTGFYSNLIENNQAQGDGGGVYIEFNPLVAVGNIVRDNTASGSGGGYYIRDYDIIPSTVSDIMADTITGNTVTGGASQGGGIYKSGNVPLYISASTISGNQATLGNGGGVAINFETTIGVAFISASTISGNSAASGGGIRNEFSSLEIAYSTISGNTATGSGGGFSLTGTTTGANTTIFNSTISGNTAGGGALQVTNGATAALTNVTVAGNNGTGTNSIGGLYAFAGEMTLTNTLLAGNTGTSSNCFQLAGFGTIIDSGGNLADDIDDCPATFTEDTAANINLGALADNGGGTLTHALGAGSVAINATGACPGLTILDQRGALRDGQCDIGAYEANTAPLPALSFTVTPLTIDEASAGTATLAVTLDNTAGTEPVSVDAVFGLGGTATLDVDYTISDTFFVLNAASGTSETLNATITAIADGIPEPDETIIITLISGAGATVVGATQQTVTIIDTDTGNTPPDLFAGVSDQLLFEDEMLTVNIAATDPDSDPLAYFSAGLPDFVTLTDNGDGTAELLIAPLAGDAGLYPNRVVLVSDGQRSAFNAFTIEVLAREFILDPRDDVTILEGDIELVSLNFSYTGPGPLAFSLAGGQAWMSLDDTLGALFLSPPPGSAGTYPVIITGGDGVVQETVAYNVIVTAPLIDDPEVTPEPPTPPIDDPEITPEPPVDDPDGVGDPAPPFEALILQPEELGVTELPATGESPLWRSAALAVAMLALAVTLGAVGWRAATVSRG